MHRHLIELLILVVSLFAFGCSNRTTTKATRGYPFQEKILEYAFDIAHDGTHTYYWPQGTDDTTHLGTTQDIDYLGTRLSSVWENQGTHCVGVSWQVAMTVLQDWAKLQNRNGAILGMTIHDMKNFVDQWFIKLEKADELASLSVPEEMGSVYALTNHSLGEKLELEKAEAGDFVQFWRMDSTGHSCIFLHWVYDTEGDIIGFRYWGSQPQTNGIGTYTEYFFPNHFSLNPNRLADRNRFYVGRLAPETK